MPAPNGKPSRRRRVSSVENGVKFGDRLREVAADGGLLLRLAACAATATIVVLLTSAWRQPFAYRVGDLPLRDIHARAPLFNELATREAQERARSEVLVVYRNNPFALEQLRNGLENVVAGLLAADELSTDQALPWRLLLPENVRESFAEAEQEQWVRDFLAQVSEEDKRDKFLRAITATLQPYEERGLLKSVQHPPNQGDQSRIEVRGLTDEVGSAVDLSEVRISDVESELSKQLSDQLASGEFTDEHVYQAATAWIVPQLPTTLSQDEAATEEVRDNVAAGVQPELHPVGHQIAAAASPLTTLVMEDLREEYREVAKTESAAMQIGRAAAAFGMYGAIVGLCWLLLDGRRLASQWRQFGLLLAATASAIVLGWLASFDPARAELIPVLVFAMTMAIVYGRDRAFLFSCCVALAVAFHTGRGLACFVVLTAGAAAAIASLGRIRKRSVLIRVGLIAAVVVALTSPGVEILAGRPLSLQLVQLAATNAGWALAAGCIMTVLLPGIERMFGVLTELRLLELGDASHPLLQQLVRQAPGTYNHSINVASLAEAAAERIGAQSLLVRVGAYFHDIGKMLKPEYFVENQERGANQHESLVPAMSKLIIVAHVKDGAQLAKTYRLPAPLIDFIEQHHGTTLVEYFYRLASERKASDPNCEEVSEDTYRYPGPKPQTKEAAVLMLADVVESAARALVEPTPARIESLVQEIARKRLLDGQFDECDLTLQELSIISESLVKNLNAVYHGRVKYAPEAASA